MDGDITAGSGGVLVDALSNNNADVDVVLITIGGLGTAAVNVAHTEVTSAAVTDAVIGSNSTTTAPGGAVEVKATSTNSATASTTAFGAGVGVSVSFQKSEAFVAGRTKAEFNGTIPSSTTKTASLLVQSRGRNQAISDLDVVTVSLGLAGTGVIADAEVTDAADTQALVGSTASINISGQLTVDAALTTGGNGKQNYALTKVYGGSLGGISAGLALTQAIVAGSVEAKLSGAVAHSGSITINADSAMHADADTTFFGIGGLTLTGTSSIARVAADTIAGGDGGTAHTNGAFIVTSDSAYTATATTDGATVGLGTLDVKLPEATVSGATKATYLGQVTNGTSASATAVSANTATAIAEMIQLGALAGAVGYALAQVTATTEAGLGGASVGSGIVSISATSDDDATAEAGGGQVALVGITLLRPDAKVTGTTRAFVGNNKTVDAGTLNITAIATPDAIATAKMVQISVVGGFDASPRADVGGTTESYIGFNETVNLGGGAATLTATRTANAKTEAARTAVSLIEVAFVDLVSTIGGTIAVHIDDRADVTAGSVSMSAGGTSTPLATNSAVGVRLAGASGSQAKATDTTTVNAYVGPAEGVLAADVTDPTNVTTSGTGLSVTASLTSSPLVTSSSAGFSLAFDGAVVVITAESKPTLRSYLGDKATVTATGTGDASFVAAATATAIADAAGFSISLGVAAGLTSSTATLTPTVKAFTVGGGSVSARNVTFNARANMDASGNPISPTHVYNSVLGAGSTNTVSPAFARVSLPTIGLAAGVAGGLATATNSPIVFTSVAGGTQITAGTLLKVRSDSFGDAQIDALALGVGIAAGVGIVKGTVTSAGAVTTRFDGNSTGSAAAQVVSSVKATALAEGRAAGGSIVAAIAGGSLQVFVKPVVLTAVNGTLVASGTVDVKSDVRTAARAFYHALSISGFVSGTVGSVSASPTA